ncbi:pilin [Aliivibrio fischeri]|uniref:pilin n=1 Tax=Aliivibrio fischeri TaxID=668 RepID=UPI0007C565E2|nr:pilin [Aliivibrio fischeri]MUI55006.1 prepilin-type N-terminal cleavage/methylation domain-containing protein [Aliivibrio fischeri]OCH09014.1 prepilin-type N-terminal cleavage/methylation domain-containing protein [Aliivibrio fischeri]
MKKRQGQKGFTLIELMIVVAVIGVLSAIAMPQYQKYVAKAEVASALATLTGIKTNVEAYSVENGVFPAAGKEGELGVPTSIPGGTIAFAASASAGSGTITYTFKASGVSSLITGKKFQLARTGTDGSWACDGSATTPVTDDLLPKNCK